MVETKFNQEYCLLYLPDDEYEEFVEAWIRYHEAADLVDGHTVLGSYEQIRLAGLAVKAGNRAMGEGIRSYARSSEVLRDKFNRAKLEALRRLENGQSKTSR